MTLKDSACLNEKMKAILRIYIVNQLSAVFHIKEFTKETIEIICLYLYKYLTHLILELKFMVNGQGRTLPNFFHLLYLLQDQNFSFQTFVAFIKDKESRTKFHKDRIINFKQTIKNVIGSRRLYALQYHNIYSIPKQYLVDIDSPLPLRKPVSQIVKKPPEYCYMKNSLKIDKNWQNDEAVRKEIATSDRQIKTSLSKYRKFYFHQQIQKEKDQPKQKKQNLSQIKFDMCKYL